MPTAPARTSTMKSASFAIVLERAAARQEMLPQRAHEVLAVDDFLEPDVVEITRSGRASGWKSIVCTARSIASEISSCSVAVRMLSLDRVVPQPASASTLTATRSAVRAESARRSES